MGGYEAKMAPKWRLKHLGQERKDKTQYSSEEFIIRQGWSWVDLLPILRFLFKAKLENMNDYD